MDKTGEIVAEVLDVEGLMMAFGLLCIPVILAIPLRVAWSLFMGTGLEEGQYREKVNQIIDSGMQVAPFRQVLDDIARGLKLEGKKQRLIEADVLHPLRISHFLLLPALVIFPLAILIGAPIILLGLPVLLLTEFLLIKQQLLIRALVIAQDILRWQVVHIPRPNRSSDPQKKRGLGDFSTAVEHFTHVPQGAFLGLFSWLMVHWTFRADSMIIEFAVSAVLYIILLGILNVLNNAFEADLVFVDPSKSRMVPVEQWLESILNPLIGIGLIFLIGRNLLEEARTGNPTLFAMTVLSLLYGYAIVGFAYSVGGPLLSKVPMFDKFLGSRLSVRERFEQQVIESLKPLSYDLTRHEGHISFSVRMSMSERISSIREMPNRPLTFSDLESLPSASADQLPQNPFSVEN